MRRIGNPTELISKEIRGSKHRKTGILCTVGMNNSSPFLESLIKSGMNVMRINCSHGDLNHHSNSINNLKEAIKNLKGRHIIGTLLDIRGPKMRIGLLGEKEIKFGVGDDLKIKLVPTKDLPSFKGNKEVIYCDYMKMPQSVNVGQRILIDDGMMQVMVTEIGADEIKVRTLNQAILKERKGVIIPGSFIDLPAVSEKDKKDIEFAVEKQVDFIAASFIQSAENVREVRKHLGEEGKNIKIVSKVENQSGLDNIDEIIKESDGVMVARGDLGTELPPEKMFSAQKSIINKCNLAGVPVITATQMLESMTNNPYPTRAECTDIANAILDGTDCVMLSGETANGQFPSLAVDTMSAIAKEAENRLEYQMLFDYLWKTTPRPFNKEELVAASAVRLAYEIKAKLILVYTKSPNTVRYVSKYRPYMPIVALSKSHSYTRSLGIYRGVIPHLLGDKYSFRTLEEIAIDTFEHFSSNGFIHKEPDRQNIVLCIYSDQDDQEYRESSTLRVYNF